MESFSDDERFEVDSILEQRKRKGIQQYLVKWKEGDATWEPAVGIAADCAAAIEAFINRPKSKSRRSSSNSRKSSRSRSRSHSRSRKESTKAVRKSSRSRSRGRQTEAATKQPAKKEEEVPVIQTRRSLEKGEIKIETEVKASETKSSLASTPSSSSTSVKTSSSMESNSTDTSESQSARSLHASTMEPRKKLEVQRVHNEQRPVREDDNKPRSAIWKIADYTVIVLFIISFIAAIFMFLEKFLDLENFKKQAYPSFETLSIRLHAAKDHLVDVVWYGWDRSSDAWDYVLQQVKPQKVQPVPPK